MSNDLLEAVRNSKPGIKNGRCEVVLCNGTPHGWQVTIKEAGCKFFYRDGSEDIDGPRPVNLEDGDCISFFSKKANGCVKDVYLVMKVHAANEPNDATYEWRDSTEEGKCLLRTGATLGPKSSIEEAKISSNEWSNFISVS